MPNSDSPYSDTPYSDTPYSDTPYSDTPYSDTPWSEVRETRRQIGRFLIVGGASVATDLSVYALLIALGAPPSPAKAISYVAGVVVGLIGNKLWTFESARKGLSEPVTYFVLYAITLGVNVAVNAGTLAVAGPNAKPLAFFVATAVTTVLNFLGMRFITFRKGIHQRKQAAIEAFSSETNR